MNGVNPTTEVNFNPFSGQGVIQPETSRSPKITVQNQKKNIFDFLKVHNKMVPFDPSLDPSTLNPTQ